MNHPAVVTGSVATARGSADFFSGQPCPVVPSEAKRYAYFDLAPAHTVPEFVPLRPAPSWWTRHCLVDGRLSSDAAVGRIVGETPD